jgi:hypothetical protein
VSSTMWLVYNTEVPHKCRWLTSANAAGRRTTD